MTLTVYPEQPTTLQPIIAIWQSATHPQTELSLSLVTSDKTMLFSLPFRKTNNSWRAEFWLEQAGTYEASLMNNQQTITQSFTVKPHSFMTFQNEITIFTILFFIMGSGIILWNKYATKKS